jgi:hypothetical protein
VRARDGAGLFERMPGLSKRMSGREAGNAASTAAAQTARTLCVCRGGYDGQRRDHGYEREDLFHEPVPWF